jgi:hypothetical protein
MGIKLVAQHKSIAMINARNPFTQAYITYLDQHHHH